MRTFFFVNAILLSTIALYGCSQKGNSIQSPYAAVTAQSEEIPLADSNVTPAEQVVWQQMENADQVKIMEIVATNQTYKGSSWTNPNSNIRYTVVPMTNLITIKGKSDCRRYRLIANFNSQKRHVYGVACKRDNGQWEVQP